MFGVFVFIDFVLVYYIVVSTLEDNGELSSFFRIVHLWPFELMIFLYF